MKKESNGHENRKEKSVTGRSYRQRLVFFLWMFAGLPLLVPAQNQQQITVELQKATMEQVIREIKQTTRYQFFYRIEDLPTERSDYSFRNSSLQQVMDRLTEHTALEWSLQSGTVVISKKKPQLQERAARKISGLVTDESGAPLPGVSVVVKGSTTGVATDIDGRFALSVPNRLTVLVISFIGKKSVETTVGDRTEIAITLVDDKEVLEEVVITGYQDISKPKMTGSVTTINAEKLNERYTANVIDNLEGRVAGLSTYNGKTTIRGTSSLFAETSPLLVVDGLPIEGRIEDLNPADIASVNILKDAAATAIYGARASNGIIVITTKSAKTQGKIDIDITANLTLYERRNMDYHDNFYLNAEEQVDMESAYWDYYYLNNEGEVSDPIGSTSSDIRAGARQISPIQYAYHQLALGEITREQLDATLDRFRKNNFAREYADKVLRRRVMQQYNLSLRGRSEKMQNNLTLNYRTDNAGQINSGTSLLNVNYKGGYDLASWLTATFSVNGIFEKTKEPGSDYNASYTNPWSLPAYETMYNEDGSDRPIYYMYSGNRYWELEEGLHDLGVNIRDELHNNTRTTRRNHQRYHGELLFRIIEGLTFNTRFIYENDRTTTDWLATEESHLSRTIRNVYSRPDEETGRLSYLTPESGGMMRSTNTNGRYWTFRSQVGYDRTFGRHAINAIAGLEFRETRVNGSRTLLLGYDDQLQNSSTTSVNFGELSTMTQSPYYMQGSFPAQGYVFDPYLRDGIGVEVEERHRYGSGYFNFTYTYDERYNLFASIRKDYADVYGLNADLRGRPLWSVGVGWNIHHERFMKEIGWVNLLKPRASYGVTGNIYQGATSYMTATSTEINRYTGLPLGRIESPANPDLKWEQSRTTNIGLDFSVLDNRLRGAVDYYNKVNKDIFSNRSLDPITGFTSMFMNTASMRNRGVELALSYDWLRKRKSTGLGWSTGITFSHNKNKITSVENPAITASQLIDNPYREGYPTSALWSYRFAGISENPGEEGSTLWHIEDGNTAHSASRQSISILEYSGQTDPKTIVGMDNNFSWRGFNLNVLLTYYGGHKMRVLTEDEYYRMPYMALPSYLRNSWTPENPTDTPGIGRYYASSTSSEETRHADIAVHDASFLKIRNIVLGYDLPELWCRTVGVNRINLRVQVDNPRYLWVKNKVSVDPETLSLRNPSSFVFGLNINL